MTALPTRPIDDAGGEAGGEAGGDATQAAGGAAGDAAQNVARAALAALDPPADLPDPDLTRNALTVLERRYLTKDEHGDIAESPRQLFWRVARSVAEAELAFDATPDEALEVARDFYTLISQRVFLPNSPCLTNAGKADGMLSACFVLPVEDSVEGIYDSIKATALIQKAGGGTGFSFSRLRPAGDRVESSGGAGAGPLAFMDVFSKASDSIQQGAFRKGANMGILRIDHPDIDRFIVYKDDRSRLTNYNISVAVTDRFIRDLREDPERAHEVRNPNTGVWSPYEKRNAKGVPTGGHWTVGELWEAIVSHAHATGEPGVVFIDRINAKNPIKNVGEIEATNPCGEQPLHAWDSCNLGSINLGRFVVEPSESGPDSEPDSERQDGRGGDRASSEAAFHWEAYKEVIHTATRFLDDVIEVNRFPLPQITEMSRATRRIGLGVMGFADALYKLGIPYDSEEGCAFGEEIMRVLEEESHIASEVLAEERGVFPAWEGSEWEARGRRLRNSYTTTIAPTGTISIIAGCSGGIEPMFSLAFERQVMTDTDGKPTVMREVNEVFETIARHSGYFTDELVDRILAEGTIAHEESVPADHRRLFVTAHDITPEWHMRMQAAFQRHCDSSISKTINFPYEASVDDVRAIYDLAIDLDVKGVTVYRDGCREMQPMALRPSDDGARGSQEGASLGHAGGTAGQGGTRRDEEGTGPAGGANDVTTAEARAAHASAVHSSTPTGAPSGATGQTPYGVPGPQTGFFLRDAEGGPMLQPVKLPEIMPSLRIRQMTPFGNMHVKVSVDPSTGREREVFAQLGKGGDVANSDLEAICRILSLWLRSNGSLQTAVSQLSGIGSSLTVPTKDGRIMSLADGLATALRRYMGAKETHGLEALLLGKVPPGAMELDATGESSTAPKVTPRNVARYNIKCPTCSATLSFEEGCVKCHGCGFSQC